MNGLSENPALSIQPNLITAKVAKDAKEKGNSILISFAPFAV